MSDKIHAANASTTSVVEAPPQLSQADSKRGAQLRSRALERAMGMAERYLADNLLRQAAEMYFEVVGRYAGAPESARAHEQLLEIAEHYEDIEAPHEARGIYERLL